MAGNASDLLLLHVCNLFRDLRYVTDSRKESYGDIRLSMQHAKTGEPWAGLRSVEKLDGLRCTSEGKV